MLWPGTDPESYITEHTLVYEDTTKTANLRASHSDCRSSSSAYEPSIARKPCRPAPPTGYEFAPPTSAAIQEAPPGNRKWAGNTCSGLAPSQPGWLTIFKLTFRAACHKTLHP